MFKALLKVRLLSLWQSIISRSKRKESPGKIKIFLYILLAVYIVICVFAWVGTLFVGITKPLVNIGMSWLVMALAALMCVAISFIGSIFMTQHQIYEAKDNELLLSMPIPPSYILASRLFIILLTNMIFALFVLLPAFVVYCMEISAVTISMVIIFIIAYLLISFLSTALSCVFGGIVAFISSKMRRKNLISTVMSILLFMFYMYVNFNLQKYALKLVAAGSEIAGAISKAFPPAYLFGTAIDHSNFAALFYFAVWCLVPFLLVYFVLSKSFIKIATTNRGNVKVKYKEKELKTSSFRTALIKKELARFFSLPMYILNCSLGAIMSLVAAGALIIKGSSLFAMFQVLPGQFEGILPLLFCGVLCFMASVNDITAPSISLEGKTMWILKSLPITPKDICYAKIMSSLIITIPPAIISAVTAAIVLRVDLLMGVMIVLTPAVLQILISLLGLVLNLKFPRFEWISEIIVIKQSASVIAAVFGGMALVAIPALIYVFLASSVPPAIYLGLCVVLYAAISLILFGFINNKGEKIFSDF